MQTAETITAGAEGDGPIEYRDDLDGPPKTQARRQRPLNGGWVLMVAAGLVAGVANYALLTMGDTVTDVLVVVSSAPAGTPVSQLETAIEQVSVEDPARFLLAPATLPTGDVVTAVPLDAGVMLRTTDFRAAVGSTAGAMSIPVPQARAAGGLLVPGDRVDVIAQVEDRASYVVSDVTVLSVSEPGTGLGGGATTYAVTVEIDREQALELARAMQAGDVDIVRTAQGVGR